MGPIASQITSLTIVYSIVYSDADKKNIKAPRHWPLCGEFTGTGEFPAQMASYAENVSIWWRHHARSCISVSLQFEFCQSFQANYYSNIHTITPVNTLRPRENGRHFADDSFKCISVNKKFRIWNKISLKFVPKGQINNFPSLVQIMVWRRPGDKPLSEPMMVKSLTHICVTRPQWVKQSRRFWLDIKIQDATRTYYNTTYACVRGRGGISVKNTRLCDNIIFNRNWKFPKLHTNNL